MTKGILISLEGPDGAGKTSVLNRIVPILEAKGRSITATREPGGVQIAEEIRNVILDPKNTAMDDKTELLLYIASRRQHLKEKILPALDRGDVVLVDRFIDSSIAYQGFGRGLDILSIKWLNDFVTEGLKPDLTLYFDVDSQTGLDRISANRHRDVDRLDMETIDLHQRVRNGYLMMLEREAPRMLKLDANQPLDQVVQEAIKIIEERFLF